MTKIAYIAGPMSPTSFGLDHTPDGWDYNHPAFFDAAKTYEDLGYQVVNPAALDVEAGDTGDHPWDFYLRRDLKVLSDCTHIVLLPDWENSKGARLEHHVATELGMEVIHL